MDELKTDIEVKESDLRIEWYSGTGPGGQHRNKHQNSCRITHLPTGIVASSQTRSRKNSYEEAMSAINQRVKDGFKNKKLSEQSVDRKQQMGSGMRGDKIRTYRFQDDVVKDHNTHKSFTCTKVMAGNIDLLW